MGNSLGIAGGGGGGYVVIIPWIWIWLSALSNSVRLTNTTLERGGNEN